jgi:uncharacterized protein GlcG (DUF336 family)
MSARFAVAAGLLAASVASSDAQVITHRDVGVRMGLAIAVGALDQCEADGNNVSVAVVDRAGRLRAFLQSDKANPHNLELARRKAYTARTFGRTSVPVPTFVSLCSTHSYERRNQRDTGNDVIPVWLWI